MGNEVGVADTLQFGGIRDQSWKTRIKRPSTGKNKMWREEMLSTFSENSHVEWYKLLLFF